MLKATLQCIASEEGGGRTLHDVQMELNRFEDSKHNKGQELRAKEQAKDIVRAMGI